MPLVAAVSEARSIKVLLDDGVDVIQRVGTQPTRPTTATVTTSSDQNSIGGPDGERPATADSGPPRDGSASTSGLPRTVESRPTLGRMRRPPQLCHTLGRCLFRSWRSGATR